MILKRKTPRLLMRGAGDPKGSSVGYKILNLLLLRIMRKIFILPIVLILIQVRINHCETT